MNTPELSHSRRAPRLVLFMDSTLLDDAEPDADGSVAAAPGARHALDRLHARGISVGVIIEPRTDQRTADAAGRRITALLGPFELLLDAVHAGPQEHGDQRPGNRRAPDALLVAAAALGVPPEECASVVGNGEHVTATILAGARPILVPSPQTDATDVAHAPEVAWTLADAVTAIIGVPNGPAMSPRSVGWRAARRRSATLSTRQPG